MAGGRRREWWQHTASLLAELMNGPRTRRDKRPWAARDLDPYARHETAREKVTPQQFVRSLISTWV